MLQEYRQTNQHIDSLRIYNTQLDQQVQRQQQQLKDIETAMEQAVLMEREMLPLTLRMIDTLEQFVKLDLPFHLEERQQRVQQLRDNFAKPDLSVAEKFRQVLEAYQIEMEYGRKIDRSSTVIELDGQQKEVNVLRVGRVALLFQTLDKSQSGMWNPNTKAWEELDRSEYRQAFSQGLRMANQQASIDLLKVPVFPPQPVQAAQITGGAP